MFTTRERTFLVEHRVYNKIYYLRQAIENGYRHFDTAFHYQNEDSVGKAINDAIKEKKLKRSDFFVTSKLADHHKESGTPKKMIDHQLEKLGLDYIDVFLIHSPWSVVPTEDLLSMTKKIDENGKLLMMDICPTETWKELEQAVGAATDIGKIKSLGVSNFSSSQISEILKICKHRPQMNQVECHPLFPQKELLHFCHENQIHMTAYSPLGGVSREIENTKTKNFEFMKNKTIMQIATEIKKDPAQVLLKFQVRRGILVIPKSANDARQKSNKDLFSFEFSKEQLSEIEEMDDGKEGRGWTEERVSHSKFFPW
ncbi:unnamed protein product [Oikopleura dioica]|uniref:NADP-dependent oxidoreductase domain-containing protein n=1 Tax=Oikopleura dioica TaxID=34765 RepID=E4WTR5_OIKDI|nr:unnamed protein product [Oikopleura dioica]